MEEKLHLNVHWIETGEMAGGVASKTAWVEKHSSHIHNGSMKAALHSRVRAIRRWMGFCTVTLFTWQMKEYLWVYQRKPCCTCKAKDKFHCISDYKTNGDLIRSSKYCLQIMTAYRLKGWELKITKNCHFENKTHNIYHSLYKKSRSEYVLNCIIAIQIYIDILYSVIKKYNGSI